MKMSNFLKIIKKYPDPEWEDRQNRRLVRLIKKAKFRYSASIEETDFSLDRNLSKNMLLKSYKHSFNSLDINSKDELFKLLFLIS